MDLDEKNSKYYMSGRDYIIDLDRIWQAFWKQKIWIVLFSIVVSISVAAGTYFFIKPVYKATIRLYVSANADSSNNALVSKNDLNAAQELADIYSIILKSNTVLETVEKQISSSYGTDSFKNKALKDMINVKTVNDTAVMQIDVLNTDPVMAADIANTFAEVAPGEIIRITKAGGVEVIDYAKVPETSVSPDMKLNVLKGFGGAFIIACFLLALKVQLNQKLTTEDDIHKITDIPVLASIPMFTKKDDYIWMFRK